MGSDLRAEGGSHPGINEKKSQHGSIVDDGFEEIA